MAFRLLFSTVQDSTVVEDEVFFLTNRFVMPFVIFYR